MGQMFKDIKTAVEGNAKVSLLNRPCGEWLSVEEIVIAVENNLKKGGCYDKTANVSNNKSCPLRSWTAFDSYC